MQEVGTLVKQLMQLFIPVSSSVKKINNFIFIKASHSAHSYSHRNKWVSRDVSGSYHRKLQLHHLFLRVRVIVTRYTLYGAIITNQDANVLGEISRLLFKQSELSRRSRVPPYRYRKQLLTFLKAKIESRDSNGAEITKITYNIKRRDVSISEILLRYTKVK